MNGDRNLLTYRLKRSNFSQSILSSQSLNLSSYRGDTDFINRFLSKFPLKIVSNQMIKISKAHMHTFVKLWTTYIIAILVWWSVCIIVRVSDCIGFKILCQYRYHYFELIGKHQYNRQSWWTNYLLPFYHIEVIYANLWKEVIWKLLPLLMDYDNGL